MNRIITASALLLLITLSMCKSDIKIEESTKNISLSDSQATEIAKSFYSNLYALTDSGVLIGHQDALAYGIGWSGDEFRSDINDVSGDFPAVFGWDLGHIGDSVNIDGVPFIDMKKWAIHAYQKGGINTYSWHPKNLITGGNSWDTTSCVEAILPGGDYHGNYLAKLNLVADFFSDLKTDSNDLIPVIFRPFHEMNGGWFWWGTKACTPEQYIQLYRFTVDYLRNTRGLHNIIYSYSPDSFENRDEYLSFYPGDNYVDVLGVDDYKGLNRKETLNQTVRMLQILDTLCQEKNKIFALSETGLETLNNDVWFTEVVLPALKKNESTKKVSWILFWRNGRPNHFYAPYPGHSSVTDFMKFKKDEFTLFLSDIDKIYN